MSTVVDTRTEVETPENVTLTFQLAGPGTRIGAYFIDLAIRLAVGYCLLLLLVMALPFLGLGIPAGFMLLGYFLLEWGYGCFFEGTRGGRTPGKKFFGLRVIKTAGYPIGFFDAFLRNLLRAADVLPFGYAVALISMTATTRLQRLGDVVASTMVIHEENHHFNRNTRAFETLEPILPTDCTGRFAVSERTLDVIEQLLSRNTSLPKRRLDEIAEILAVPLADQLGFQIQRRRQLSNVYFLRRVLRTFSSIDETETRKRGR